MKSLTGTNNPDPQYILDNDNTKIYTPEGKEAIHRNIWTNIFNEADNEEENNEQEMNFEDVRNFVENNLHRTTPYHTSSLDRLTNNNLTKTITTEDIKQIIKDMRKTCPGESGINKTILKNLPDTSLSKLTDIFNATLSAGYFPDRWKTAIVRLIPKTGKNPHQATNYRPISLLEVPGKIFERVINKRLRQHLTINDMYNENQFGFRQGRGTTEALAIASEKIASSKADKGQCTLVLRDISKAFDKVWHLGLKYKVLQLNLPLIFEKLLCDFLDDRTAKIKISNFHGQEFNLNCGVPQGSVLSPTLFTIYTADAPKAIQGLNIMYADDISQIINHHGGSKAFLFKKTDREVSQINRYEEKWKIQTNINKFSILRLGAREEEEIITDEEALNTKTSGKILGLTITNSGYSKHIKERCAQANRALRKLYRFQTMQTKIKTQLIKSLVLPILEYPPIPIVSLSKTQISKLQKIQNRALRFATNQRYPYTLNTRQIHSLTKTKPINIRLHKRAINIWRKIEMQNNTLYRELTEQHTHINSYNRNFKSSLPLLQAPLRPIFH